MSMFSGLTDSGAGRGGGEGCADLLDRLCLNLSVFGNPLGSFHLEINAQAH